ncbi:serine--tRNA ligase [Paenibacillus sp. 481]|nr:serine--tRNA ligase [Paenibacillus sp. 481]
MHWIRQYPERVQEAADLKGIRFSVQELLDSDHKRRSLLTAVDELRRERNEVSTRIGQYMRATHRNHGKKHEARLGADATPLEHNQTQEQKQEQEQALKQDLQLDLELDLEFDLEQLKQQVNLANEQLAELEMELAQAEQHYKQLILLVPNLPSPDSPVGQTDEDNVEVRRVGEPTVQQEDAALDHVALGERLGLIDMGRGVKVAGTRQYYLTGAGVYLHRAVQQLAMDLLVRQGFVPLEVPLMVREQALTASGFFPYGQEQTYAVADDQWLVGTSEVSLISYYAGEIVDLSSGPICLAGASTCFRREVGSAGRDVRGLYRVHQFAKVEQVIICRNDAAEADRLLQHILSNAEQILQLLELPYRVMAVCTGDMSEKTHKQYDIETWMPSRGAYGETHSASNLLDFQARRSNIRFRDGEGKLQYAYTLNNTAVASPRILIPLLENHQRPDGSIYIPEALRPYMYGMTEIKA